MGRVRGRALGSVEQEACTQRESSAGNEGSAVLLALAVCLWAAISVQVVTMAILCGRGALADEAGGRRLLKQTEDGLGLLKEGVMEEWGVTEWAEVDPGELAGSKGEVAEIEGSEGWVLEASVKTGPTAPSIVVRSWLERSRDGLDLPSAALVAERVVCDPGRVSPWLERGSAQDGEDEFIASDGLTRAYVLEQPTAPLVGLGCSVERLEARWGLDEGWRDLLDSAKGLRPGVRVLHCEAGEVAALSTEQFGLGEEGYGLVVVLGGGVVDARNAGEVRGVLVVDCGSVLLEGTTLHGAVFSGGEIDVGSSGMVVFSSSGLFWATERSLSRVRLVPGSRKEEQA